jgi:phytoene dehydrogenase-like protein
MEANPDPVVVIGGGLGGLLAALTATERGAAVVLVEPHPLGGRARTDDRRGFTFNRGPRALYPDGPAERALRALGIDTTTGGAPLLEHPLALAGGVAHRFPDGPIATLRTSLLSPREKATSGRALLPILRAPRPIDPALTLADWLDARRARGRVRALVEALVRVATYVDAPHLLPAGLALDQARTATSTGVRYLDGGFGALVDALAARATERGVELRRCAATAVRPHGSGWEVAVSEGGPIVAASVVIAAGLPEQAARLLGRRPSSWGEPTPPAMAACLELGVRGVPRHRFCLGIDEPTYLSVHSPPARLATDGHSVVHVMRYRAPGDAVPADEVRAELDRVVALAGIARDDIVEERFLSSMVVSGAIPSAPGGLAARPAVAVAEHPGAFVVGDWVGPTGLLLDAVAASAVAAGEQAAQRCATMARP